MKKKRNGQMNSRKESEIQSKSKNCCEKRAFLLIALHIKYHLNRSFDKYTKKNKYR